MLVMISAKEAVRLCATLPGASIFDIQSLRVPGELPRQINHGSCTAKITLGYSNRRWYLNFIRNPRTIKTVASWLGADWAGIAKREARAYAEAK